MLWLILELNVLTDRQLECLTRVNLSKRNTICKSCDNVLNYLNGKVNTQDMLDSVFYLITR